MHLSVSETAAVFRARAIDSIRLQIERTGALEDAHSSGAGEDSVSEGAPPQTPPLPSMDPHYRIWLNLDECDDFADPSTLEAELEQHNPESRRNGGSAGRRKSTQRPSICPNGALRS